jgi:hypothetical protein
MPELLGPDSPGRLLIRPWLESVLSGAMARLGERNGSRSRVEVGLITISQPEVGKVRVVVRNVLEVWT